jgi:hypothetical protein
MPPYPRFDTGRRARAAPPPIPTGRNNRFHGVDGRRGVCSSPRRPSNFPHAEKQRAFHIVPRRARHAGVCSGGRTAGPTLFFGVPDQQAAVIASDSLRPNTVDDRLPVAMVDYAGTAYFNIYRMLRQACIAVTVTRDGTGTFQSLIDEGLPPARYYSIAKLNYYRKHVHNPPDARTLRYLRQTHAST